MRWQRFRKRSPLLWVTLWWLLALLVVWGVLLGAGVFLLGCTSSDDSGPQEPDPSNGSHCVGQVVIVGPGVAECRGAARPADAGGVP